MTWRAHIYFPSHPAIYYDEKLIGFITGPQRLLKMQCVEEADRLWFANIYPRNYYFNLGY
jgi:hypothetical protein